MKFSVILSDFQKVLAKTMPAMPRKSTIPVLEHLNFSLKGNTLTVISTDQDITIMSTIEVTGEEDGGILVPGRRLSEMVSKFDKVGSLEFATSDETFEIKINSQNGKYKMKGLDPDEYLDLPELFGSEKPVVEIKDGVPEIVSGNSLSAYFNQADFSKLCDKSVFAVSKDDYRPAMTGVFFEFSGDSVTAVATDSYRLSKVTLKSEKALYPNDFSIIIPARAIELFKKVDGNVVLSFIETMKRITHARFDLNDTVIISKVIDEKFPPYRSVIPTEPKFHVILNEGEFVKAVNRIGSITNQNSHQIRVVFDGNTVSISGEDEDSGSAGTETINCDYTGDSILFGFNFKYLEEALQHTESEIDNTEVIVSFTEPNKPVLIKANKEHSDVLMLVMPVRLG